MLDRNRPYAEVFGELGVKWEQGGVLYDVSGKRVGGAEIPTFAPEPEAAEGFDAMTTDQLKAQVAIYGGSWSGRAAAIKFLKGAE